LTHPAFALASRKLGELQIEFDRFIDVENEVLQGKLAEVGGLSADWARATLKAAAAEGMFSGVESLLEEIISIYEQRIFGDPGKYHQQLLAQAATSNEYRPPIISEEAYALLDRVRKFRNKDRHLYRHMLDEDLVDLNLARMKDAVPQVLRDVKAFIDAASRANPEHTPRGKAT
jgi:hypothetical protein